MALRPEEITSILKQEIKSYEDEAEEYILDIGEQALFGKHALGFPIAGNAQSVAALGVKELRAFHEATYTPLNILVASAGALPHDKIVRKVEELCASAKDNSKPKKRSLPKVSAAKRIVLQRPFQQSHLLFVRRTFGVKHKHRWAISLLNTILGDGMSSRLHQRIRERMGTAYSLYSSLQLLTDCGVISIYAGTELKTLEKTEKLIEKELSELVTKGVTRSELMRAKEQLKSSTIMALESMSARMHALAKGELEEGMIEDVAQTLAAIDATTMQGVRSVCAEYFSPDGWTRVIIEAAGEN